MGIISLTRIKAGFYSIRWKILIAYLLIISIAFGVVAATLIQLVGDYMFNQRVKDDQRVAENLASLMSDALVSMDVKQMYENALAASQEGNRVLVLDRLGVVQVDGASLLNGQRFENVEAANVLSGANADYGFYDTGVTGTLTHRAAISSFGNIRSMTGLYASAILQDSRLIGVVIYISQAQDIYESLRDIQLRVLLWLLLVAVAVLLMSMFVVRTITRPIGELNEGIARMSRGDLSSRVKVRGKNEFAQLASAFNSMSEKLESLDKSRNQFVSNASHELKTPLSTMKILLETLIYQEDFDPAMQKEFLTDINNEIDRLNCIVSDLLTLVHIDSGGVRLNPQEIRLRDVVMEQVKRLSPLARERGIELECDMRDPCEIIGDSVKLAQVIYNVIDNAIKYTPRGGEVWVEVFRSGKKAVARIRDTGIGIPEEDVPHIFDRFYRVDKARSRETGGTGLGLSIVKQIVLLHEGDIRCESKENEGSTFIIELPINAK
ncbi:MAG TPA: HAMP domain-containing protein [Candidatus Pullichristensenella excrementigallinarum]|uniref:histidine kinase n=1 Tax=Candidatus Pullichristensenella excrementigallinarum TaxID=2840907 RepID=A0A9D1LBG6_9FIRM|nr:HAMP domain-containing protein [Candidatus Pullichristensenella excrementigallinarum]